MLYIGSQGVSSRRKWDTSARITVIGLDTFACPSVEASTIAQTAQGNTGGAHIQDARG